MSTWQIIAIALAGGACGIVNSIAGGGSLILFPVLLFTGLEPVQANVTNSMSTCAGYVGGVAGFRTELERHRRNLPKLLAATVLGAIVGCVLLLVTPSSAFEVVVPWLVLLATALTGLQPMVRRRLGDREATTGGNLSPTALGAVFLATIYGGYFGGGLGVMVLAVLGLTVHDSLRNLNASKAVISLGSGVVSFVIFGLFGPVQWAQVAVAAPTTLLGGYAGAAIARRLPEHVLRASVVLVGTAVSIYLFLSL